MTSTRILGLGLIGVLVAALMSIPTAGVSGSAGSGAAEGAGTAAQGRQVFLLIQTDPNVEGGPIAARGPIHAKGTDVVTGEFRDRFEFPDGNVIIRHKPKPGSSNETFDPVTCLFTFSERGTWRAVRGTGAYDEVKGHGRYRAFGQGFACDENQPPEVFFIRIRAVGSVSY